jgi:TolA-binding protein
MATAEERVDKLQEQINKLKQEKKKQQEIVNRKKRNARTKRLIETGAIVEKYFGEELNLQKMEAYLAKRAKYIKSDVDKIENLHQNAPTDNLNKVCYN